MKAGLKRWFGQFPDLGDVVKRFPAAVMAMAVFTLIIIFKDVFPNDTQMGRLLAGLVIGAYLCVSCVLAAESRGRPPNLAAQLVMVFAAALLAWFSEALRLNLFMAVGAAVLLLGNAVIWRQKRDDLHVWDFTHKLWTGAVFAVVGSVIFTLGMLAIQETLRSLFGLNIRDLVSDFLLPIGLGFLAPLYWMATLPAVDEDYSELYETPGFVSKAVAFLGTWLLSPLALIYALILLAYGVKILLSGELPKGEIATMTTPFLLVGTLTWLVLDPPFAQAKLLARVFRKLWWPVSIPAALLLAVAVFVRIREYGYTPERFALMLLIVWALGLALWFIFAPKIRRDIRFIPGFAAALLAFGTVSAGWLSHVNQSQRFETYLHKSGVLSAEGKIAEIPEITDMDAARKAKGALEYLMRFEGKGRIADVLNGTAVKFDPETSTQSEIIEALGLNTVKTYDRYGEKSRKNYNRDKAPISIASYETFLGPFEVYSWNNNDRDLFDQSNLSAKIKDGVIHFDIKGESIPFSFAAWIDNQNLGYGDVTIESPVIVIKESETEALSLIVNRFNRQIGEQAKVDNFSAEFYVLTRGLD